MNNLMTNELKIYCKSEIETRQDYIFAKEIAIKLIDHLNQIEIVELVKKAHVHNANSTDIQNIILPKAEELGFTSEKKGLFIGSSVPALRPDYYLKINENAGIIMEVERGKTLANNMDLLDLWKCHICSEANFLFLVVPNIRETRKVFVAVSKRMNSFFLEQNFTNVDAVFIFGY